MDSRFRLIVFDLDGTLVDSRRDLAESANQLLHQSGCAELSEEAIGRMVGDGAATLVRRVFEAAECPPPDDALPRFLAIYNGRLLQFTRPYPGIPDLLASLQPQATLAVLTNKPFAATRSVLEGLDLASYFGPRVVGGDGPFPRKPAPDGLNHLISGAGTSAAETLLVGDSLIDWRTARAAAASCCLARYGFGFDGFPIDQLDSRDWVIDHPGDLKAGLLAFATLSTVPVGHRCTSAGPSRGKCHKPDWHQHCSVASMRAQFSRAQSTLPARNDESPSHGGRCPRVHPRGAAYCSLTITPMHAKCTASI